jgi:hypothetical protein
LPSIPLLLGEERLAALAEKEATLKGAMQEAEAALAEAKVGRDG